MNRKLLNVRLVSTLAHRLLVGLALGCAGLFLTAVVFAVRGFWHVDTLSYECYSRQGFDQSLSLTSRRGVVILRYETGEPPRGPVLERRIERSSRPFDAKSLKNHRIAIDQLGAREWAGFLYWSDVGPRNAGRTSTALWVPQWFVLPSLALLTAAFAWASRGARGRYRARLGLCRRCGYDLRASGDRCPECGTAVAEAGSTG